MAAVALDAMMEPMAELSLVSTQSIATAIVVVVSTFAFIYWRTLASKRLVLPEKVLPKRPILTIQFQPDDPVTTNLLKLKQSKKKSARTSSVTSMNSSLGDTTTDVALESTEIDDPDEPATALWEEHDDEQDDDDIKVFEIPVSREDLPDSFAPLLSSSHMILDTQHITPDLIDSISGSASIKLRHAVHEIPLNIDPNRPQLRLHADQHCKLTAGFGIDSGTLSQQQHQSTVQHAHITFDPPIPLSHVAPTLIHFPSLFEDKYWSNLRLVRWCVHQAESLLSILERCLWILESHCQIHLGKIKLVRNFTKLQLSFSGHVLLFGFLPIPFFGIHLPTFVIPQPYALLNKLMTKQPLASAKLKHDQIAEESVLIALINTAETWDVNLQMTGIPPDVGVDVTFPGGLSCAVEVGLDKVSSSIDDLSSIAAGDAAWTIQCAAKGTVSHEKMSFHILKLEATGPNTQLGTRGSFAVWKHNSSSNSSSPTPRLRKRAGVHPELQASDNPSVASILLFPDMTKSFHNQMRLLQYDYLFDVMDDTRIGAATISIGATHPMLNGGTMITTVLEGIYAFGSVMAREDSILDPNERRRKRNILRHLPATDFTCGVQNIYIPPESECYTDDGQSLLIPEMEGGRMMLRFLGGVEDGDAGSGVPVEGIQMIVDFELPSLVTNSETYVKEYPELDIYEGVKLLTHFSGVIGGSIKVHLRPQQPNISLSSVGPNVFNPLEAYEIEFSNTSLSIKMKEFSTMLGHRRVMFPAESTFQFTVIESVVDMGFEGKTTCDLSWDFQGLSPILQVTTDGQSPVNALPENKVQVALLISPLRQGRFSLSVSSVGGISITKAATSRDDKEGLYDWKFFNALVSPDEESFDRIWEVIHDRRTIEKLLQILKLVNDELYKISRYIVQQVWRAKEIFDKEGVKDPKHAIPMYKMARLISLFMTGDVDQVDSVLPIMKRVIEGEGLDTVRVKDLLRRHLDFYDTWAPEIDRMVHWAAVGFGPVSSSQPYVEDHVCPLAELPKNKALFSEIPAAKELYEKLLDKPQLPLDPSFSNLVATVAPYLNFKQVQWILETRATSDWQASDLRRIRYVFSIKRKVKEIAESYGGLSFLPQSFLLSVLLGEATRTSHRVVRKVQKTTDMPARNTFKSKLSSRSASGEQKRRGSSVASTTASLSSIRSTSTLSRLRKRRHIPIERPLAQLPESTELKGSSSSLASSRFIIESTFHFQKDEEKYELGDSLLGPQDAAILLQAGLTSVMKSSSVVQLNQRMLLDLIGSQPKTFAIAVLAEIGPDPRSLTSALMALLELDQTAFKEDHKIDIHSLLETWFPELKIPRRDDHMAGGRWARQSYYEALFSVATHILEDTQTYKALRNHLQRVRICNEDDALPQPRSMFENEEAGLDLSGSLTKSSKFESLVEEATSLIAEADSIGNALLPSLLDDAESAKSTQGYSKAVSLYNEAFTACAAVVAVDKHAFHNTWFGSFYKRNYDALMIKSMYDNVVDDTDRVRYWLGVLFRESRKSYTVVDPETSAVDTEWQDLPSRLASLPDDIFDNPEAVAEQHLIDAIIEASIYNPEDRKRLSADPLVRLLIPNPDGHYDFTIVSAAGVVTDGEKGVELKDAFDRLHQKRGVTIIRADTATARSLEYNASKVEEAIEVAVSLKKPYGLLGYSQGCANALLCESVLYSGTPRQRALISKANSGLVCRQLLFSAANGSFHGPAVEKKVQQLISMCEDFFKSQAGYFSKAFASTVLEVLNSILDSAHFHKIMGGAQSFLPDGCRDFWREAQHLSHVPTCTIRGVLEKHTTPESLEMLSNLLKKQSGSALHDSQVHGYPVYSINRNGRVLKLCAVGDGAVQRTHHWSPLDYEVEFVRTPKDVEMASFDCAKDRHVFPWIEVNKRFGFIKSTVEK